VRVHGEVSVLEGADALAEADLLALVESLLTEAQRRRFGEARSTAPASTTRAGATAPTSSATRPASRGDAPHRRPHPHARRARPPETEQSPTCATASCW
jgi:hypothetical protein